MPVVAVMSTSRPLYIAQDPEAVARWPVHGALAQHDVLPAIPVEVRGTEAVGAAAGVEPGHGPAPRSGRPTGWRAPDRGTASPSGRAGRSARNRSAYLSWSRSKNAASRPRPNGSVARIGMAGSTEGAVGLLDVQLVALEARAAERAVGAVQVGSACRRWRRPPCSRDGHASGCVTPGASENVPSWSLTTSQPGLACWPMNRSGQPSLLKSVLTAP